MSFIVAFRLILMLIIVVIIVSQVLIPLAQGRKMFPFFRKERRLEERRSDVLQEIHEATIELEVVDLEKKLTEIKKKHEEQETKKSETDSYHQSG